MARQIFVKDPQKVSKEELKQQSETFGIASSFDETSRACLNLTDEGKLMLIRAEELAKLLKKWNENENSDLYINSSLASRIREYLKYQEEIEPLKRGLAERMYSIFKCNVNGKSRKEELYYNNSSLGKVTTYEMENGNRAMSIRDLKIIMQAMDYQYAMWIPETEEKVDYVALLTFYGLIVGSGEITNGWGLFVDTLPF